MSRRPVTALGIDVGSTNTKAVLVEVSERTVREIAVRTVPTPAQGAELIARVSGLARDVVRAAARPPAAVGIAAMAETGTLWGDRGPAGPLLRWDADDAGLRRAADELVARAGAAELYAATGVPVPAKTPLARWHALRRDGYDGPIAWAGVADAIGWALTGELATDHTLAQRTMAYLLPGAGAEPAAEPAAAFDRALLELAGVDAAAARLPRVTAPGQAIGAVRADAASAFGLQPGTPVFLAGHDHAVGAWAAGVRAPGEAADSLGTAEALLRVAEPGVDRAAAQREGLSIARDVSARFETVLAGNPSGGALIARLLGDAGGGVTDASAADDAHARPLWPLLLPYSRGRQSPAPEPRARLRAVGADGADAPLPPGGPELLYLASQGLALQLRWMDAAIAAVAGGPAERTIVLGGPGARSARNLALRRALLPGAVAQASVLEPVASGAALFAAVHAGLADPSATLATRALPGTGPDPAFDGVYAQFVRAALNDHPGAP